MQVVLNAAPAVLRAPTMRSPGSIQGVDMASVIACHKIMGQAGFIEEL